MVSLYGRPQGGRPTGRGGQRVAGVGPGNRAILAQGLGSGKRLRLPSWGRPLSARFNAGMGWWSGPWEDSASRMNIARFAVSRRVTVAMIATAIVVLGIFAFPRLPIDLLPAFSPPVVNVEISYANVAPETMETLVTRPMENAVSRVPGVQQINSTSSEGDSQ